MSRYKFTDKSKGFWRNNAALKDMVLGRMAADIERGIKMTAGTPVKTGDMKAETRHFRSPLTGGFRVEAAKEYSAVQEAGGKRGGARFQHYTTPGTSGGWFRRAINSVVSNKDSYIKEAARALNL